MMVLLVPLGHCLKRLPLRSFTRLYAAAAAAAATESSGEPAVKKRVSRARKSKAATPPPPTLLDWTSVQEHLDQLAETNGQIVLADIERCRPAVRPSEGSPAYKGEYNALVDKISKAFTTKQLRHFLKLYEISLPAEKRKRECVIAIMEHQWNWPSLSSIEAQEKNSKSATETFALTPREAFLILGKDGTDFRDLSLRYNVHIEYQQNPLALLAAGPQGSLHKLAKFVEDLRNNVAEDTFELPMDQPIRPHLLRRISRISGAFTQDFGPRKILVSFNGNDPRAASVAKRLTARAVSEGSATDKSRLLLHLPPAVASSSPVPISTIYHNFYSLYPFVSPRDLPWTAGGASGVFRLRRVEEWYGTGASENLKKTGGLLMGRGRTITPQQQDVDLWTLFSKGSTKTAPGMSRTIVASVGHVLLTSPPAQHLSIVPPLSGNWKLPQVLDWMTERSDPAVFIPTIPMSVLDTPPTGHRMLRRLIYNAIGAVDANSSTEIIKVECDLESTSEQRFHSTFSLGQSTKLDMMIPDRPADIQFSIFDLRVLSPAQCPPILQRFIANLISFLSYQDREATQPEPPLTVEHDGATYVLHSNLTVRQSIQPLGVTYPPSIQVITESVLDLDGDQKSTSCQVTCDDLSSDDTWKSFMQLCDEITTVAAPTISTTPSTTANNATPLD